MSPSGVDERAGDRRLIEGEAEALAGAQRRLVGGLAGGDVQAGAGPTAGTVAVGRKRDQVRLHDPDAAVRELEAQLARPRTRGLGRGQEGRRALAVVGVDGGTPAVPQRLLGLEPREGAEVGVDEADAAVGRNQEQAHRRLGRQARERLGRGGQRPHAGEHRLVEVGRKGLGAHTVPGEVGAVCAITTFSAGSRLGSSSATGAARTEPATG